MLSFSARWTEGLAADLEIEFSNWGTASDGTTGFTLFDGSILDFGKAIEIQSSGGVLFSGKILSMEGRFPESAPPTLVVRADDGLQDLRMTRRTRSFENVSDSDILTRIAQDHSLTADVNLTGPTRARVVQANQSDLAFARERARIADADLWVEDGKLRARSRASRESSQLELARGANLLSFQVAADLAHQRTSLVVGGWDLGSKQAVAVTTAASDISDIVDPSGKSGPQVLQDALGDRVDTVAHAGPWDDQDARAMGKARFSTMARSFLRGRGRTVADPNLRPGRTVRLTGLGPWYSGEYGIAQAEHRFDQAQGLWTEIALERAWIGQP